MSIEEIKMSVVFAVKKVPLVRPLGRALKRFWQPVDGTQSGEFDALRKVIKAGDPKFLVEIGSNDGHALSNSRRFLLDGWHGVLIEPSPSPFSKLSEFYSDNPNVLCLNNAVSDTEGEQGFWFGPGGPDGLMGTLCTDKNDWFNSRRSEKSITVTVRTLTSILEEANYPQEFGLLLVDAEGMDYECLRGLNFEKWRPKVIMTEEYRWNTEKHRAKYELLKSNGYSLVKGVGCNTIWRSDK